MRRAPPPPLRARGRMGKLEFFQWLSPIEFSFGEMEDYLYQVAQNHSDLVKVSVEGLTEEGRPIYLLKIGGREAGGDNEAGPLTSASTATIFIDAGRRLQLLLHLNPFFIIRTTMQCTKRTTILSHSNQEYMPESG